jgi:hypothetical protein
MANINFEEFFNQKYFTYGEQLEKILLPCDSGAAF